jgi:predicted CoA-binding protein
MHLQPSDNDLKEILGSARTIAVVGLSPKPERPSNRVANYLIEAGYRIIPVNPGQETILGQICYPDLDAVPEKIDIVDIFRKSADVPPVVEQAIEVSAGTVWLQQGIVNDAAAERCRAVGITCVMDSCIKIEHARLLI